ncbi:MAG: dienelactone hydrolase family protein [Planctomycetes bacterium]|nr:dienelactone hydrolase family protein [Planctomycetota bacterium]
MGRFVRSLLILCVCGLLAGPACGDDKSPPETRALAAGDHERSLPVDGLQRSYLVHVPKNYDPKKRTPVVLALHGATMNAESMARFCGLNTKADEAGFIAVYPNGTGKSSLLFWNAGGDWEVIARRPDDVAFIGKLLDDLATVINVDQKRVYACGMSNGAMMCYRLAAEMSDRIAAIAPVAGTIAVDECVPQRPVPIIHFHGTNDKMVPFETAAGKTRGAFRGKTVAESIETWVSLNECDPRAQVTEVLSKPEDELQVTRCCYGAGKNGAEVVLVVVEGGGHTWPGRKPRFRGKSALNISANDLIWEFFEKHPLP